MAFTAICRHSHLSIRGHSFWVMLYLPLTKEWYYSTMAMLIVDSVGTDFVRISNVLVLDWNALALKFFPATCTMKLCSARWTSIQHMRSTCQWGWASMSLSNFALRKFATSSADCGAGFLSMWNISAWMRCLKSLPSRGVHLICFVFEHKSGIVCMIPSCSSAFASILVHRHGVLHVSKCSYVRLRTEA